MADCHIGSWRDPRLRDASTKAFLKTVEICIEKQVDFVLIAGDLFNTALPGIDALKLVVTELKKLKDNNIPVYTIPGSHDFSPSGKTIIDVLENAGLLINVMKGKIIDEKLKLDFTADKTGAKITGIFGKKGMLEKSHYKSLLKKELEQEKGFKIFMFHTALSEFKPEELDSMESQPLELLPKNFDYYAGGHVHYVFSKKESGYGLIAYPGPLFPNSFSELEKLENGGFYIVEKTDNGIKLKHEPIIIYNVFSLKLDCNNKSPEQIKEELEEKIKNREFINTIVTIRLTGILDSGKPSDINIKEIFSKLYDKGAYFVMKNTFKLTTKELNKVKAKTSSVEDVEDSLIKESIGQIKVDALSSEKEEKLTKQLMAILSKEKQEGERVADFEKRIKEDIEKIIKLD